MASLLPVSDLVSVDINLSPQGVSELTFGILMICGDSNVISGSERFRSYTSINQVASDFGTSATEYLAALNYFNQKPQPKTLMIGRWLRTATSGFLPGEILNATQQTLANFTAVTSGGFHVTIDGGSPLSITGLNFSAAANLNAVAALVQAALTGATCTWTGSQFVITSTSTGTSSTVSFATPPASGTDISTLLGLTAAVALPLVPGFAAETPVQCVAALIDASPLWYGLMFAASTQPTDSQNLAVAALIEAQSMTRLFGVTITNSNCLSSAVTSDLGSELKALNYNQSMTQYSSSSLYAIASLFGRAFSVNFQSNSSTITLMYKQEPGIVAENLTESQASVLKSKNINVFVAYVNGTMIIQYGVVASGEFIDTIQGVDWLQNAIQTEVYNLLYTSTTKIPQTDAGVNQLVNAISAACQQGVANGLIGPGTWNASGFGQLVQGQYLNTGYYIYATPLALQSEADRAARIAPPIQVAVKLAGAIQLVNIQLNVNQ